MDNYIEDLLGPYIGWKFVGIIKDESDTTVETVYGIVLQKGKNKVVLWALCDPEGNGPGFLQPQKFPS